MRETKMEAEEEGSPGIFREWRLLGVISATLVVLALVVLMLDPGVEGLRRVIRLTARTSLVLFCMAFVASSAWRMFPNGWTCWQLQNRRYIGLGFAASHGIHAVAIASFAALDPVGFHAASMGNPVPGGIAYAFIILMSATSFDRSAAWIGRRTWKILHAAGMYYLFISFVIAFGKRIPQSAGYVIPLVVLGCALALRVAAAMKAKQRSGVDAGLVR